MESSSFSSQTPFQFLNVVSSSLPNTMSKDLAALCSSTSSEALLDNLIRFVCGADCSSSTSNEGSEETQWASKQALVRQKLGELLSSNSNVSKKRSRYEKDINDSSGISKKQKLSGTSTIGISGGVDIDPPKFTLQSISVTSPIRKKADITLHQSSVRFVNPSTRALEASLPLSSLRRAFLLPTRGKPKPHWTVVILSNDTGPEKKGKNRNGGGKGDGSSDGKDGKAVEQIIFGLDAIATSVITSIFHSADVEQSTSLRKGDETLNALNEFFSQLSRICNAPQNSNPNTLSILHLSVEKIDNFKSFTGSNGGGGTGITLYPSLAISANLAAKPGTLWFTPSGILWSETKPCIFWSLEDLAKEEDVEGVRTISATGRVCTVVLTRRLSGGRDGFEGEGELEETGFGQIEGKEQEAINQWVRKYRYLFGGREREGGMATTTINTTTMSSGSTNGVQSRPSKAQSGNTSHASQAQAGPLTINQMIIDSDDDEDDVFDPDVDDDASSSSGSETSSGDENEDENENSEGGGEEGEEADADADADADAEGDSEDEFAMDPIL